MFDRDKSNNEFKAFDVELEPNLENGNENKNSLIQKNKMPILLIILAVIVLGGFLFYKVSLQPAMEQEQLNDDANKVMFIPMDEMTINLKAGAGNSVTWLRLKVVLEVKGKNNYDAVSQLAPKVVDIFQTYLKELRQSDLEGSFGIYKIKNEMMMRINTVLYPKAIDAILFQEIIVQTT